MKKFLAILLALGMAASLAACVEKRPTETTGSTENTTLPIQTTLPVETTVPVPDRENKLIYATAAPINGDFAAGLFTSDAADLMNGDEIDSFARKPADAMVADLLVDYGILAVQRDGTYAFNMTVLAKEPVKTENPDGTKTFTVQIKPDLTYNTGKPITAKDYIFPTLFVNSAACATLNGTSENGGNFPHGKSFYNCETPYFSDIRLIDDYTWSVTVAEDKVPYVFESTYVAASPWDVEFWFGEGYSIADGGSGCYLAKDGNPVVMDTALAEAVGDCFIAARYGQTLPMVSAGPYQLVSYDSGSREITLERNPNYAGNFEGQKPSIETLVITNVTEEDPAEALVIGSVHVVDSIEQSSRINALKELIDHGADLRMDEFSRAGYGKLQFACDVTPTQFVEVRQAIACLLDRQEIVDLFCQGLGSVVNGPYNDGLWMTRESEEVFAQNLKDYRFDLAAAERLLNQGGWTLDENGDPWEGEGLRYKEVSQAQAEYMDECVGVGDKILMPLLIKWAASEDNVVSDLLETLLARSETAEQLGMGFAVERMDFATMLGHLYRQDIYGYGGGDFQKPHYSMFNLASGWDSPLYDDAYHWTDDAAYVAAAYNTNFLYDLGENGLHQLSMDMVYGVAEGDRAGYLKAWQDYVIRWNQLLPDLPLYANLYATVYPAWLEGYDQDTFWGFQHGVLYASIT